MPLIQPKEVSYDFSRNSARLAFFDTIYHFLSKDSPLFGFCGKVSKWDRRLPIASIAKSNPVVIESPSHGLSNGDIVSIDFVMGMEEINGLGGSITVLDNDRFEVNGIDSSLFSVYGGGGVVFVDMENNISAPSLAYSSMVSSLKSSVCFKRIHSKDVAFGIEKRPWVSGSIYQKYDADLEVFDGYVVRGRDLYICLDNANGSPSLEEPSFRDGVERLSDGYLWMHLYRSDVDIYERFSFDESVFPMIRTFYLSDEEGYDVLGYSKKGSILNVEIVSGGSGYLSGDDVSLVVNGDGVGASIICSSVSNGIITGIEVLDPGEGYTWAEISVNSSSGSGAILKANLSPFSGIGHDPVSILKPKYLLFSVELNGDEGGKFPVGFDVRQFGIVSALSIDGVPVKEDLFSRYHVLRLKDVIGSFAIGEKVIGDGFGAYIIGVEDLGGGKVELKVVEAYGKFPVFIKSNSASGVLYHHEVSEYENIYGDVIYLQNTKPIHRMLEQSERITCKIRIW